MTLEGDYCENRKCVVLKGETYQVTSVRVFGEFFAVIKANHPSWMWCHSSIFISRMWQRHASYIVTFLEPVFSVATHETMLDNVAREYFCCSQPLLWTDRLLWNLMSSECCYNPTNIGTSHRAPLGNAKLGKSPNLENPNQNMLFRWPDQVRNTVKFRITNLLLDLCFVLGEGWVFHIQALHLGDLQGHDASHHPQTASQTPESAEKQGSCCARRLLPGEHRRTHSVHAFINLSSAASSLVSPRLTFSEASP